MTAYPPTPSPEKQKALWQSWRGLSRLWALSGEEQENLLGTAPSTAELWSKDDPLMTARMAWRMETLFECYKFLRLTVGTEENGQLWLRSPNNAPLYNGRSPLAVMMADGDEAIAASRTYIGRPCDYGLGLDRDGHKFYALKLLNAGKTTSLPPTPPRL